MQIAEFFSKWSIVSIIEFGPKYESLRTQHLGLFSARFLRKPNIFTKLFFILALVRNYANFRDLLRKVENDFPSLVLSLALIVC